MKLHSAILLAAGTICGCAGVEREEPISMWEWMLRENKVGAVGTLARDVLVVEDYPEELMCRGERFADCDSLVRWLEESDGAVWSNGVLVCCGSKGHLVLLDALVRFCRVNGVPLHYRILVNRSGYEGWVWRLVDPCPGTGDGNGPSEEILRRYGLQLDDWTKEAGRAIRGEPAGR